MPPSPSPSLRLQRAAKSAALVSGRLTGRHPGLVVLLYHRVGAGERNIDLSIEAFRRQMAFLAAHCEVVPLSDGLRRAADPSLDRDLVSITFDDGTEDLHEHAFPILAEFALPATLYLATGPCEEGLPFPSWATGTIDAPALGWDQVNEMIVGDLVTIGSHTHTHADLDAVDGPTIREELRRSKELIEDRTGRACVDFAYPHAVTSPEAEAAVRRTYDTATIAGWKKNRAGRIDPYRITRTPVTRADGPVFFKAKVGGRMEPEAWLYKLGGTRRA